MKLFITGAAISISLLTAFSQNAIADEWGCEVILCLANPGGPMQYKECVKPVKKLYRHLAKGKSFPKCSGAGYSVSRPVYEPYSCEIGELTYGHNPRNGRRVATCQTTKLVERPLNECSDIRGSGRGKEGIRGGEHNPKCYRYEQSPPIAHEKPNRITVNITGQQSQTIRY